jgi:hypothetical protein
MVSVPAQLFSKKSKNIILKVSKIEIIHARECHLDTYLCKFSRKKYDKL